MRRSDAPERFLATVLFTDIVGSTELAERLGDRAWRELLGDFYSRVRRHLRRTSGTELDTAGDGLFAAFDSPANAIECAVAVTREVQDLGIAVRCGLHTGEAERLGRKIGGIAVHIGARVAALAAPSEVLVTRTVRDLAAGSSVRFEDRGERELKGIEQPWRLYAVVAERATAPASTTAPTGAKVAPMRRRRRPIWARHPRAAGVIGAATALAVAAGGYLFVTARPVLSSVDPESVGVIDPERGGVVAQVRVGGQPADLAWGEGAVWVVNTGSDTVSRLDAERLSAVDTIQVGAEPEGIAVGFGAVWVANSGSGTISQINPATNTVVRSIQAGNGATDVVAAGDSVWVANVIDGTVSRISPDSGEVVAVIRVGASPSALAGDEGSVWVTNRDDGAVTRIDIAVGEVVESVNVGSQPSALAVGAGALWVGNAGDGTVSRIDVTSRRVVGTIVVAPQPSGIAVGGDAVWVASGLDGSVARMDPDTGSPRTIRVGSSPQRIAVDDDGRVWFTTRGTAASHRGGTLRVAYPGDNPPSLDPAVAYSTEEWYLLNAGYNGLVGYRNVVGAGGSLLVPNLAEAIPTPGDGGTSYTFRLREGMRYSNATPVGPADLRHAIERGFEVPGSEGEAAAPVFFGGIVGADACTDAIGTDADCDLAEGIEVDENARTVTIHLVEADPDFLHKLAMPFAYLIPADTPSEPVSTPIPATGPYMIAEVSPSSIRLVRNPEFRVWSAEARPDGFPDEIVWDVGGDDDGAVDRVEAGVADVLAGRLPLDRVGDLLARHTGQLHVRAAGTMYMALDTTKPPFDDIRVRQAVNFAVDRERAVELIGGETQATVTCQVILPNFHGYRRFCPYTIDPGPAGIWTGPDRAQAVELVAASGTAGAQVEVWTIEEPAVVAAAEHLADVLADLGFKPSLTVAPPEEFVAEVYTTAPDREPVAVVIGWLPDYPAASTFLEPNFSCGVASNLSRYCDPGLEERMDEARRLQATDPVAAADAWADVDREITEAAAWVPVVNFTDTYFVSERVGNVQLHAQWGMLLDQMWVQ